MLNKRLITILSAAILFLAAIGGSFYAGYNQGTENPKVTIVKGVTNLEEGAEKNIDFKLFWEAWNVFKEKYVGADKLSNQDLLYGAISGVLGASQDPHTVFFPPAAAQDFNQEISGEFGGVGMELGIKDEQLTVIAPLKDTPAEKAGIQSGDLILKINGEDTTNITVDEAVKKIRGKSGTKVTVTVFRKGWTETKDIELTRGVIQIPTLDSQYLNAEGKETPDGDILYLQLHNFYEKSPLLFYQAALEAIFKNPRGIILDLRNNPGGFLEASVNIAGWFMNKDAVVVKERFRDKPEQVFTASGTALFKELPVVVLINGGSASASEILAGALRDNRNAKLIGEKSFGKGSVQEVLPLGDGSFVKITVANWLTPKDTVIEKNGLTPDIEVKFTEKDIEEERDPQLEKAVEILKSEISK